MPIDRTYTLTTLRDLIRIDSRNPGLEAGAPGEWELAQHVSSLLRELGWEAVLHELGNRRANVVARRAGTGSGPSLMINVHLDTVGVEGMRDPFSATCSNGRIWGRGAQDTKGGAAAALGLAKALTEAKRDLHGDLVLAFVADEEHKSIGTERLIQEVVTDAAIVLEPSDLDVCVAHRGFGIFRLRTRGRTAHGGSSDFGIDANLHMGHLLVELDQLRTSGSRITDTPLLDRHASRAAPLRRTTTFFVCRRMQCRSRMPHGPEPIISGSHGRAACDSPITGGNASRTFRIH